MSSYKFDRNQYRIAFLAFKTSSIPVYFSTSCKILSPLRGVDSDTHNWLIETLITVTLAGIGSLSRRVAQQQRFHLPFEALQLRNYEIRAREQFENNARYHCRRQCVQDTLAALRIIETTDRCAVFSSAGIHRVP